MLSPQTRFGQICVTISKFSPNMCEKSCQKYVTISVTSRSTLLSFCQICVTITKLLIVTHIWQGQTDSTSPDVKVSRTDFRRDRKYNLFRGDTSRLSNILMLRLSHLALRDTSSHHSCVIGKTRKLDLFLLLP